MLPLALCAPAGDHEISAAELEGARRAAAPGPEQELARLSQRNQSNHGLLDAAVDVVRVPGHAVLTVAIEVEADGVEFHSISLREAGAHLFDQARLERRAGAQAPGSGQARFEQAFVVHAAGALLPVARRCDLLEESAVSRDPARRVVHPRARIQLDAPQAGERGVDRRLGRLEQVWLEGGPLHGREL